MSQSTPAFLDHLNWPADISGDVYFEGRERRSLAWADGKPSLHEESNHESMGVRVLEKGAEGIVVTRNVPPPDFPKLVSEARTMAAVAPADPTRRLAQAAKPTPELEIDTDMFAMPSEKILERFGELERRVLEVDSRLKKIVKFQFSETRSRCALRNTFGAASQTSYSATSFMAEILAEQTGETEVAWDSSSARFGRDINIEPLAMELARNAVQSLGGRALTTGNYAVVLDPRVGVQILELLAEALSAEAVQMGRSFAAGKKGRPIISPALTIVDDPLLPEGLASAATDDEGTPRSSLNIIEAGVLTDYFTDLRTGARDGLASNGRGHRASVGSAPKPSATNFYVQRGQATLEQLLSSEDQVFLVRDVMGLHMADRITGEFSLGAAGLLYKNGQLQHAVRGVTMAGTVSELLGRVQTVGSDFKWYGSLGSPSLFIKSISIAGA